MKINNIKSHILIVAVALIAIIVIGYIVVKQQAGPSLGGITPLNNYVETEAGSSGEV